MSDFVELNTAYDQQTVEVFRRALASDSTCVDVGCHAGAILREMLQYAPDGILYAFEPIPSFYQYLEATFPSVRLYNLALADTVGESTFQHVTSNPGYSGLKQRRYDRPDETIEEIVVKTDRLDNIVPENVAVALIKIDVEGAELNVMRGAERTLRRCRPIVVFEHGLGGADRYGASPELVYDLLSDCGLEVSLMADWLNGGPVLGRQGLVDQYYGGPNFYFMAHRPA